MHDKYTRAMFICFTCIIVCVLLSSAFSVASGEDGKGKGAEDKNWLIDIEMSPTNPAKNQEVTLRAQVMDSLGNPGKNIPLDISLTSLKSPPDIVGIDFLDDPEPMTDGNGTFETIFNAPYFHSHDDGLYRIDADAEVDGGTVTPASGQLDVKEIVLELRGIKVAEPAAPGTWYNMAIFDFDRTPLTINITQNNHTRTRKWSSRDWDLKGGMYTGRDKEESNAVYETFTASDDFASLWRCEGDSQSLIDEYGYPTNTTLYSFLVAESYGELIHVEITGFKESNEEKLSFDIPSIPLMRPSIAITYNTGQWFLKSSGGSGGTWQNDRIHIYGIGFDDDVRLTLTDDVGGNLSYELQSENGVTHFKWNVPEDADVGVYTVNMEGTDHTGSFYSGNTGFFVAEAQKDRLVEDPEEVQKILGFIAITVLLLIFSIASYTRMKRKKILNHLTRKRIHDHVDQNPGIHFRAILTDLDLKTGTLAHHLNVLEREEYLCSYQDGMYRRFRLFDKLQPTKIILSNIQDRIVSTIKKHPGVSQSKISKEIGSSRIVVNYHVKILNDVGMIFVEKEGRESRCYVNC